MKMLLINPPVRSGKKSGLFPSGLGYIASSLMEEGHQVKVLDINAYKYSEQELLHHLQEEEFDAAGITSIITGYGYVKWLSSELKKLKSVPIIAGGLGPTSFPEMFLKNTDVDIIVDGEGEVTIKELLECIEHQKPIGSVRGIWYKKNNTVHRTGDRELIENLDALPFPAWEKFPMNVYLTNPISQRVEKFYGGRPYKNMGISTIRGCPYRCTFCYHCFQGKKIRFRSPQSIIDEILMLKEKYGVEYMGFFDDLFLSDRKRVFEFCEKLEEQKIDINWGVCSRVNLVDREILEAVRAAGCIYMTYGFESGSQKILDIMKKCATVDQAKNAIRLCREVGIEVDGSFIIGMVGETKQTVEETISFCKETDFVGATFFATPLPGTTLYDQAKAMGLIPDEEAYILKMGEFAEKPIVNLTSMSMEELTGLQNHISGELLKHYLKKPKKIWGYATGLLKDQGFLFFMKRVIKYLPMLIRLDRKRDKE